MTQGNQQNGQSTGRQTAEYLQPLQRASKAVNDVLTREAQYPELDSYVGRKSQNATLTIRR